MVLLTFKIIVVLFALFAWSRAFIRYKEGSVKLNAFLLWTMIWIGVITVVLHPQTARSVANLFGVQRPVDVLVYGSIVVLFYLIFRVYVLMDNMRKETTKLVREIALQNPRKKK